MKFPRLLTKTPSTDLPKPDHSKGFTLVEVLIALAVAGTVILIVFLAVPAMRKAYRDSQRDRDAALLATAIRECMVLNNYDFNACKTPESIPLLPSNLSIFTGFHYGGEGGIADNEVAVPPTEDEPNWLFNLECTLNNTWIRETSQRRVFVVTYVREGTGARCLDG